VSGSLTAIIGQFKPVVSRRINKLRSSPGAPVWQRNYYEHIVRNQVALEKIRHYVANNPARWDADQLHPDNPSRW
jgi:REP element-mobilizing transposase RayT